MRKLNYQYKTDPLFKTFLQQNRAVTMDKDLIVDIVSFGVQTEVIEKVLQTLREFNSSAKCVVTHTPSDTKNLVFLFYIQDTAIKDMQTTKVAQKFNTTLSQDDILTILNTLSLDIIHQERVFKKKKSKVYKTFEENKFIQMKEMINMIAHHWRQPLNTISSQAMNLELADSFGNLKEGELQRSCKTIQKTANDLSKMITIFSSFIEPGKSIERFSLLEVIDEIASLFDNHFQNIGITLELQIEDDLSIYGDSKLFKQVFLNIMTNSIDEFEDKNINQKLIIVDLDTSGPLFALHIRDNAGGVKGGFKNRIFNPYFTTKGENNSVGLGLSVAKEIMRERFGGDLEYKQVGGGSEFIIYFDPKIDRDRG